MMLPPAADGRVHERNLADAVRDLRAFTDLQEWWLARAADAHAGGHDTEAIVLAQNQLHAVLRKHLWLQSLLSGAWHLPPEDVDDYLSHLLAHPWETMPRGVGQRELYGAAARFEVLDEAAAHTLVRLHEEHAVLLREAFTAIHRSPEETLHAQRAIAEQLLRAARACIDRLRRDADALATVAPTPTRN